MTHIRHVSFVLRTVCCALCTVCCALCTVHCVLCAVHCVLCTVCCALCTVHCVLCTVHCVLCTVCCALCTVYSHKSCITTYLVFSIFQLWTWRWPMKRAETRSWSLCNKLYISIPPYSCVRQVYLTLQVPSVKFEGSGVLVLWRGVSLFLPVNPFHWNSILIMENFVLCGRPGVHSMRKLRVRIVFQSFRYRSITGAHATRPLATQPIASLLMSATL